jgi:signal recognition particle subunit SEC65
METKTLHFKIGADAGILLMNIAQEHLLYELNPEKAIKVFTDSFGEECPMEMKLKILKGDMVIIVDEKDQMFVIVDREKHHETIFPKLDIPEWYKRKHNEIGKNGKNIYTNLGLLMNEMADNNGRIDIDFSYENIIKFTEGDVDPILEELSLNNKINEIEDIIRVTKNYLETTQKIWNVMDWLQANYPKYFTYPPVHSDDPYEHIITEHHEVVDLIITRISEFININYKEFENKKNVQDEYLYKFIKATKEIDDVLSNDIKTVNMLDGYSAGWLAPDGTYYGLNGEIANMLHNQIATALYKIGVIPNNEDNEKNPDVWLDENGWVKQHNNWILYCGYVHANSKKMDIPITDKQIDMIVRFGQTCHKGMLKIGFIQEMVTAVMFGMIEPLQYKLKWFRL